MPAQLEHSMVIPSGSRVTKRKSSKRSKKPSAPCNVCGKRMSRKTDLPRHEETHNPSAEKLPCPWEGCGFSTLQKSNLLTHYRRHIGDKSFICIDDPECEFESCDPASLLRHRKNTHDYMPQARQKTSDTDSDSDSDSDSESSSAHFTVSPASSSSSSGIYSPLVFPPSESLSDSDILSLYYGSTDMPSMDFFNPPLQFPGSPPPLAPSESLSDSDILSLSYYGSTDMPSMDFFNPPLQFPGSPPPLACNYEWVQWDNSMPRLGEIGYFDFFTTEPDTEQLVTTSEHWQHQYQ